MPEIWERQPYESSKAYAAFCIYRDLGTERSLDKALAAANKKPTNRRHWARWMDKYNWLERARAYDDYLERKKREEKEKAILEMAERHARLAMAFQQRVAERLREINPSELSPSDMAKWLDVATKLERLSRGEPTEIGKRDNVNLTTDKDGFRIEVEYVDGRSDGRTERNDKE
ncbi:MAG TPA: hypothetical protein PK074_10615 [Spirochaetales bacterium]|nr:hypothetical protein [Spirochaetales bacterium]